MSKENKLMRILVILSTVITITVNSLANILRFNGNSTADVSFKYPSFFAPANYVFSIWGVIYLGLISYTVYQAGKNKEGEVLNKVAPYYILSSIVNTIWIILWHYEQVLATVVLMIVLLISLIKIYYDINNTKHEITNKFKFMVKLPFSIYLGWISVATIANIASYLQSIKWDGLGIDYGSWTIIMILIAAVIGIAMIFMNKDYAYNFVLIWAFVGIAVKIYPLLPTVGLSAIGASLLLGFLMLVKYLKENKFIK